MKLKNFCLLLAAVGTMAACGTKKNLQTTEMIPEGDWRITAVNGQPLPDSVNDNRPFLSFNHAEKRVHGNSGCNIVNGSYSQEKPGQLKFGLLMSTMMACPDMETERTILAAMELVASFAPAGKGYELLDKDGKALIRLEK